MAGHAAQQHVLLQCPGICQLVNTLKSSIPDHRLAAASRKFTAGQHFAYFQRNSAGLACHVNITRSTDSEAVEPPIIGFNIAIYHSYDAEVGEPLKGPLKDTFKKGRFLLHQNQLSKEVADRPSVLAELAPRFFAEQDYEESRQQPLQPPRCNGKGRGVHSVLRSGVEQRSFAHTVSPLGALPSHHSVTWDKSKEQADDARDTSTDTLGCIMSSHACGGRALELLLSSHDIFLVGDMLCKFPCQI